MKENYQKVEIEVVRFEALDIVTQSGGIELPDEPIDD